VSDRLTPNELAKVWGVSRQAVDKQIKNGRLTVGADKKIARADADRVRLELNPNIAAKEAEARALGGQQSAQQDQSHPIVQARTMEAVYKAKQRELSFKLQAGALVPVQTIKNEGFEAARAARLHIMAIPQRLTAEIVTCLSLPRDQVEPAIRRILEREAKAVLGNLIEALEQITAREAA
jgi:hypothetical protein